jgi:hypothetical protein
VYIPLEAQGQVLGLDEDIVVSLHYLDFAQRIEELAR